MGESGLFGNQRQTNVRSIVALIEKVMSELGQLGYPASVGQAQDGLLATWHVTRGSAAITISVVNKQPFPHLRVCATVITLDNSQDETVRSRLAEHLLAENVLLLGAAFAMIDDRVLLIAQRSTLDLDHSEITDITKHVMDTADHYDDALIAQYGGQRGGRPL